MPRLRLRSGKNRSVAEIRADFSQQKCKRSQMQADPKLVPPSAFIFVRQWAFLFAHLDLFLLANPSEWCHSKAP